MSRAAIATQIERLLDVLSGPELVRERELVMRAARSRYVVRMRGNAQPNEARRLAVLSVTCDDAPTDTQALDFSTPGKIGLVVNGQVLVSLIPDELDLQPTV